MTTTVKRVNVPAIGSPLDKICTELFDLECELYEMKRTQTKMRRRIKDLRKARTILKRLEPKPVEDVTW